MIRHHYIAVLAAAALALGSCTTDPTLRAIWYRTSEAKYLDEVSSIETGPFMITVQNHGPKDVEMQGIRLSPTNESADFTSLPDFKSAANKAVVLPPGGVLTITLAKDDTDPVNGGVRQCTLPVAVEVEVLTGGKKKQFNIALGGLPSFLPEGFERCNADYWRTEGAASPKQTVGTAPSAAPR